MLDHDSNNNLNSQSNKPAQASSQAMEDRSNGLTATYSPDDNKLRLYASARLDDATYQRVKAAGFRWAPKQELFVAPQWTPSRADLLTKLCGEIGDEDVSLVERAERRAERFDEFSDKRASDATRARDAVKQLADGIPFGQPILVGHHSERKARKHAQQIENGMRHAVRMWETSDYWTRRAAGALSHAKYLERVDVRARRIKKIEADLRKVQRNHDDAAKQVKAWDLDGLTQQRAAMIAGFSHLSMCFTLAEYPRALPVSQYEGDKSLWSALNDGIVTPEQAKALAVASCQRVQRWAGRWIEHYTLRLSYERAMLNAQGGTVADKTGPEKGGAVRCWAGPRGGWAWIKKVNKVTVTVEDNWGNGGGNFTRNIAMDKLQAVMTVADVAKAREDGRLFETEDGTGFILRDRAPTENATAPAVITTAKPAAKVDAEGAEATEQMRASLREGVQVAVAPLFYPTPAALAEDMINLAELSAGMRVLDPSAGTGVLLHAARNRMVGVITTAVELDHRLVDRLRLSFDDVKQADFLTCGQELGQFDAVLMNPPFNRGADIAHIKHAYTMLKPGGVLVGICANGPRQNEQLRPLVESTGGSWTDLPAGSFKNAGTNVNTAMLVIRSPCW